MNEHLTLRPVAGSDEYPKLVEIWASAVDATHDFLADADREQIRGKLATEYFPQVRLTVAERDGEPVGFCGTAEGNVEMLFVHAGSSATGVGAALLRHAVAQEGAVAVDVNEQNPQALGFYEHLGFEVVSRSERDGQGLPYPLLHLRLRGR
ncbi:GCN5 family acetyltransferase [Arthrobacter sp. YC-RL1]|uniref:acetyltransferase n=1 Tax=Arthrobacter sp. YC-RL1 TaxID=1652545 RepID=UPI00063D8DA2|nr:acetyltransferase [Arthrobacter sp. YC-RL1]ALQ30280.1 GCN5 family acetyltransferase [Arthrobacter sp. YC-RL1]KLI88408.1 GCN5 family acetyltransferase [Arthrobacter sp. YC-RL1]